MTHRVDLLRTAALEEGSLPLQGDLGGVDDHTKVLLHLEIEAAVAVKELGLALDRAVAEAKKKSQALLDSGEKAKQREATALAEAAALRRKMEALAGRLRDLNLRADAAKNEAARHAEAYRNLGNAVTTAQNKLSCAESARDALRGIRGQMTVGIPDGSVAALSALGVDTDHPITVSAELRSSYADNAGTHAGSELLAVKFRMRAVQLRLGTGFLSKAVFPAADVKLSFHMSRAVLSSMYAHASPVDPGHAGVTYCGLEYWHPHVNHNGHLCLGSEAGTIACRELSKGNLLAAVEATANVLSAYNDASPYVHLRAWCHNQDECESLPDGTMMVDAVADKRRCPGCARVVTSANRCGSCSKCCGKLHRWDVALAAHSAGIGGGGCYVYVGE